MLCAALLATGAIAASPKLQTIDVTPTATTISVGQQQSFTATGTFSNGSKQALGSALANIAAGSINTCALRSGGGVQCWGYNHHGELGDGNITDSLIPRGVRGINTATAVAVSESISFGLIGHGCAVLASGKLQCWGDNNWGELGHSTTSNYSTRPVTVDGIGTATAVTVGSLHSCALLASGEVQCWGFNYYGQLGNGKTGTDESSITPVPVTGISTATALASGEEHSCALLVSGAVQCWGFGLDGQLGNGTLKSSSVPVTVKGITNAIAVAAGFRTSCALLASGEARCWGFNKYGQLGSGSTITRSVPMSVKGISTAISITTSGIHSCAVLRGGSVRCWGGNATGALGDGSTKNSSVPVRVSVVSAPVRLVAGDSYTCALLADDAMRCWGTNYLGQLGNGQKTNVPVLTPVNVVGTPGVAWTSSNRSTATIDERGVATALAAGNTTITATTAKFINDNAVLTVK